LIKNPSASLVRIKQNKAWEIHMLMTLPAKIATVAWLLVLSSVTAKAADFTPETALLSLKGEWKGTLSYRDYKADKWFSLPEHKTSEVLSDGHSLLETAQYDDGPKTGVVYIYTLSGFEPDGKTLKGFSTRKGRSASSDVETVRFGALAPDPAAFVLVFESDAFDDDRPAKIRVTLTYKDNHYTTLKEVNFTDDQKDDWLTRNKSELTRVTP
jgi:hypothetical protein